MLGEQDFNNEFLKKLLQNNPYPINPYGMCMECNLELVKDRNLCEVCKNIRLNNMKNVDHK